MSGWCYSPASLLQDIMESIPTFKFAFVFFMVTSSWTLLSILTAVASQWQKTNREALPVPRIFTPSSS